MSSIGAIGLPAPEGGELAPDAAWPFVPPRRRRRASLPRLLHSLTITRRGMQRKQCSHLKRIDTGGIGLPRPACAPSGPPRRTARLRCAPVGCRRSTVRGTARIPPAGSRPSAPLAAVPGAPAPAVTRRSLQSAALLRRRRAGPAPLSCRMGWAAGRVVGSGAAALRAEPHRLRLPGISAYHADRSCGACSPLLCSPSFLPEKVNNLLIALLQSLSSW